MNSITDTERWRLVTDGGMLCRSSLSIQFSFLSLQRCWYSSLKSSLQKSASVWTQLPWRWEDEQQRACVCVLFFFFFLPSPAFFFGFLSLHLLAFACFSQSWSSVCRPTLRSSLSQSEWEKTTRTESDDREPLRLDICWGRLDAAVYTSQLPLRSRLNSVKPLCPHAPFYCSLNELNTVA